MKLVSWTVKFSLKNAPLDTINCFLAIYLLYTQHYYKSNQKGAKRNTVTSFSDGFNHRDIILQYKVYR